MPSQQIPAARPLGPEGSTVLARAWQSIARRLHAILLGSLILCSVAGLVHLLLTRAPDDPR